MPVTALFAFPLVLLYLALAFRVIGARRGRRVEIGDGGDRELLRRMRVHANAAEYIPLALIVLGLAESLGAPAAILFSSGAVLSLGRALHAYALSQEPHVLRLRVFGMVLTMISIFVSSATAFVLATGRVAT